MWGILHCILYLSHCALRAVSILFKQIAFLFIYFVVTLVAKCCCVRLWIIDLHGIGESRVPVQYIGVRCN